MIENKRGEFIQAFLRHKNETYPPHSLCTVLGNIEQLGDDLEMWATKAASWKFQFIRKFCSWSSWVSDATLVWKYSAGQSKARAAVGQRCTCAVAGEGRGWWKQGCEEERLSDWSIWKHSSFLPVLFDRKVTRSPDLPRSPEPVWHETLSVELVP